MWSGMRPGPRWVWARAARIGASASGLKRRGLRAPVLAIGDGALGFWAAVRDVWPETAEQRCWVHRIANVLDKLPRSLQPRAKQALHEIMYADTRATAEREIARFTQAYHAKYPKAVGSLTVDQDRLLAYFDYPAEHWKHLRTTNPIESTFATVRLREGVTKGAGSRTAGLVMAFKLLQSRRRPLASSRRRRARPARARGRGFRGWSAE